MGENDNKYGQYFFGSVPARGSEISNQRKNVMSNLISEGKSSSVIRDQAPSFNDNFISGGTIYNENNAFQTRSLDPSMLNYPDRISQNSDVVSSVRKQEIVDAKQMTKNIKQSVGKQAPVRMRTKKEKNLIEIFGAMPKPMQRAVVGILVTVYALGAVSAMGVSDFSDSLKVDNYVEQYDDIYDNNVRYFQGVDSFGDQYRDFDTIGMGREIAMAQDPEAALYAVYSGGDYMKYDNTHQAFMYAKEANPDVFGESKTFEEYAASLGCIDKDGKIDYDLYEQKTEARLLAKQSLEENSYSNEAVK